MFVWNVLYLAARNDWQNNPDANMSEYEVLTLPEADVLKLAQSCFYGLTELPEVLEGGPANGQLADYVSYDKDSQVYTFAWAGDELQAKEETYIAVNGYAQVGEETGRAGDGISFQGRFPGEELHRAHGRQPVRQPV